jgi:hypothetical protein
MLRHKTHLKKLSYFITITLFLVATTINAQGKKPPAEEGIGPEGGTVDAGHNCSLIIPAGALQEVIPIQAASFDAAVVENPAAVVETLNEQIALLASLSAYLQPLPKTDDGSGEWINSVDKRKMVSQISNAIEQINQVLEAHSAGDGWGALDKLYLAFRFLDDFAANLNQALQNNDIGYQAYLMVQADINQSSLLLQTVDDLYHSTLTFELSPHGTEFLLPADLVMPFKEISIADESFWYSTDGELIDVIQMDYFIDEVNETVHFLIPHFSYYYYPRR